LEVSVLWSRSAWFALPLLFAGLSVGCAYGNGSPCEAHSDCASGVCCSFAPTFRGVCRADTTMCTAVVTDTGVPDDTGPIDTGAIDTGVDAPMSDGGPDAPVEDTGVDAPSDDAGLDAPADDDAGTGDTGVDAPA
jgi:hypothetical protein